MLYIKAYSGEPVWLSEINLGIGRETGTYQGITREWLYWYDDQGKKYLTPEERIFLSEQETLSAKQETFEAKQETLSAKQKAAKLAEKLISLGIDPESLDS